MLTTETTTTENRKGNKNDKSAPTVAPTVTPIAPLDPLAQFVQFRAQLEARKVELTAAIQPQLDELRKIDEALGNPSAQRAPRQSIVGAPIGGAGGQYAANILGALVAGRTYRKAELEQFSQAPAGTQLYHVIKRLLGEGKLLNPCHGVYSLPEPAAAPVAPPANNT